MNRDGLKNCGDLLSRICVGLTIENLIQEYLNEIEFVPKYLPKLFFAFFFTIIISFLLPELTRCRPING